jgi:23S rRNA pseudouridine955/2504/2580 synthase
MPAAKKTPQTGIAPVVRFEEIDEGHSGQRLDNYLISKLKGVPKTHIYRLLRKGEVRINKGRTKPDYRLKTGDIVRIPPVRTAAGQARTLAKGGQEHRIAWLEDHILFEDDALLVVNKPSGLAVHGGSGISLGLIESLRQLRPHARFLELAHRLDRDTSGCLVVAKKRAALLKLHEMLRDGKVDKRYLALIMGEWQGKARRIDAPLQKNQLQSGERRVNVSEEGKESASRFTPRRVFPASGEDRPGATLVEIRLLTGRTHQARVHAAHIGQPIAGDDKYGDKSFNRQIRGAGLQRLFLHAASLTFAHPVTGAALTLEAPLPAELATVLDRLTRPD